MAVAYITIIKQLTLEFSNLRHRNLHTILYWYAYTFANDHRHPEPDGVHHSLTYRLG